ncbi:MAG: preprotein translocase subunit YajC [Syntrophomonas sp.]
MGSTNESWLQMAIYFGAFMAIFYFLIIMPRRKQEKKHKEVLETLKKGDRVVSIGGIRGEIARIKEDFVVLKVSDNTEIEFIKKAIAYRVEDN